MILSVFLFYIECVFVSFFVDIAGYVKKKAKQKDDNSNNKTGRKHECTK